MPVRISVRRHPELPGDCVHQQRAQDRKGERVDDNAADGAGYDGEAEHDGDARAERGGGRYADREWADQRVARKRLHHDTGDRERRPGQNSQNDPREPQEEHDLLLYGDACLAPHKLQESIRGLAERDVRDAHLQRDERYQRKHANPAGQSQKAHDTLPLVASLELGRSGRRLHIHGGYADRGAAHRATAPLPPSARATVRDRSVRPGH